MSTVKESDKTKKPIQVDYPEFEIEQSIDPEYKKDLDKITFDNVTTSNVSRTLRNIRKNVTAKIKSEFGITDKEELNRKVDIVLKTQGLHESNFDFMTNFENGLQEKLNDISIDDNANKGTERSYKAYITDLTKPVFKLIGHDTLYRVMKDLYGRKEAKRLSASMYDYSLGISDSTGIGCVYCWALDTTKLVTVGRDFGTLKSSPAHRVSSYMSAVCETVHQISNHLMGACALATIFLDIAHLMIYKQRITLDELKHNSRGVRKTLENEFQQFIHSINFNSRTGGTESPFTNVSVFDKVKLRSMLSEENYAWYFPNKKIVSTDLDKEDKISDEDFKNYVIDYIFEVQKVFIDFFDKGDPLSNGANYKFPVCFPGEEIFTLNNHVSTWNDAFGTFGMGWTDVSQQKLYTMYKGKPVKINRVFKGLSTSFIKFDGTNGRTLTVTPGHKFEQYSGGLIEAQNIGLKTKLSLDTTPIEDNESLLHEIDVASFVDDTSLIGYKLKPTEHVKSIFQKDGEYNHSYVNAINFRSVLRKTIRDVLRKDDFTAIPKHYEERIKTRFSSRKQSIPRYIDLNYDFGRFLGLFYAEGHNSRDGEMGIALNKNELETIAFVHDYLHNVFGIKTSFRTFDSNGIQICFNSKILAELLFSLVNKYAHAKCFSSLPLNANKDFRLGILHGLIEGDGWCNAYSAALSTVSKLGAHSIMLIANSLGVKTTLKTDRNNRGFSKLKAKPCYTISFSKKDLIELGYNTSQKLKKLIVSKRPYGCKKGFIINSIKTIECSEPKVVYNIEVDNADHLFTLPGGIVTSNCTLNISKDENNKILDKESLMYFCKKDISKYNVFCSLGTKIASCCRMVNSKEMMDSFAAQVNSLGGGGTASMGSHRVVTINFQRIALEAQSMEDYYKILKQRIDDAAKILKAHKLLIFKLKDAGLQSFINNGYINPGRLFSTFGILGTYEAQRTLRQKFNIPEDVDIVKDILTYFNAESLKAGKQYNIVVNQEQIPAESMAVRFATVDKTLFNFGDDYYKLYANQHVPLWEDKTIFERLEIAGKYDQLLTGGSIVHLNIDGDTTPQQNFKLIDHAVHCGTEHFAINKCYTICNDCGEVMKHKTDKCEKCGSTNLDYILRIIGYFVRVSAFGKVRREWEFPRRVFTRAENVK